MENLGLIINPVAGMGGRVGLKGTDGPDIVKKAKELGAIPMAGVRTEQALANIAYLKDKIKILTCPEQMGAECASANGFKIEVIGDSSDSITSKEDTKRFAVEMAERKVKLILFAGGDGTARDIYNAIGTEQVVLGIPAGVKIHSGVYACNPSAAGYLAGLYLECKETKVITAEVMDIDEESFRNQVLCTRLYGYLKIPFRKSFVQRVKARSSPSEEYLHDAIAYDVVESMSDDFHYIIGPGTTTHAIMTKLGLTNSLLGVDLIYKKELLGLDLNEDALLKMIRGKAVKLIVTPIGGQGYILGRGNQQLSPEVMRQISKDNIIIVATEQKIASLKGSPLLVDTSDAKLDEQLAGYYRVITDYHSSIMYKVNNPI